MKDYYSILQIPEGADGPAIRNAYRRLAKDYHPDVNPSEDAAEKFIEISEAYEYLISYRQQQAKGQAGDEKTGRVYTSYRHDEEYIRFREEAREKARQQAKMRYEEFRKQHEAFRESGLYDIGLLLKYLFRITVVLSPLIILLLTVYWILIGRAAYLLPVIIIAWIINIFLVPWLYRSRRTFLKAGSFHYGFVDLKKSFGRRKAAGLQCFYTRNRPADARPYRIEFLRLKDVNIQTSGFRQHNISYKNEYYSLDVPRSRKALVVHSLVSGIKLLSVVSGLFFLNFDSLVWRMIAGAMAGGILSGAILLITGTKSAVSWLISYAILLKVAVWLTALVLVSGFELHPFNITTGYIHLAIALILFFDCFLDQAFRAVFGNKFFYPLWKQHDRVTEKFRDGCRLYNDIPIWTVIYVVVRGFGW